MTIHAELGASSSHRWINCPGSINLSQEMPDTSSVYADEGTAAHTVAERALRKGLNADVWLDTIIKVGDQDITVTEEMCDAVQVYLDFVRALLSEPGRKLMIEYRFDLSILSPPGPMYGTSDAVVWCPKTRRLVVVDFKYGQGHAVAAIGNPQLRYYGLGAVVKLREKPKEIALVIVQPRAAHADGIIRQDLMTFDELVGFKKELFAAAERTLTSTELNVGPWCQFCKALAQCPAQQQHAITVAQSEFSAIDNDALPAVIAMTQDEMLAVLSKMDYVEEWFAAIRAHVYNQLLQGETVPGWKLTEKRATRKWISEDEAVEFMQRHGLDPWKKTPLSPAQAEKALKALKEKLPETLYEKKSSGYNMAPDSDARPAQIPLTAANEFTVEVET